MVQLTPVVRNLIIINVILFAANYLVPGLSNFLALYNVHTFGFRPYQLFTYMFVHSGFSHIFFNMLALSFFGPILESTWNSMRFLSFYVLCGIGAGAFNIIIDMVLGTPSFGLMVGASGAVYGTMTAFALLYPNMELRILFLPVSLKAKYLLLIFGGIAFYQAFSPSPGDNTANLAHLGGIVVGVILLQFWKGRSY